MTYLAHRRLALCAALALAVAVVTLGVRGSAQSPFKTAYFKGKVVPLAEVLEKAGVKTDRDAVASWMALAADDGKCYPLVKDDGARMFFADRKVLNRPVRLTGRLVPGTGLLQVTYIHSYSDGQLQDIYYWCDTCSIRRAWMQNCDCCGDPMVLREVPAR
ncbi:MAG: hypothetical protein IT429_19865 [Gemmataceae bacterium]|nr:hypothetical protein [Gemmataceae bacterium]